MQLLRRRDELIPQANIEQIAKLAAAMATCPEDSADDCLDLLAERVAIGGCDLLPAASVKQLATLKAAFKLAEGYYDGYDHRRSASARVDAEMAKRDSAELSSCRDRPGLDRRERRPSVGR